MSRSFDVVVVGAGLGGLVAAVTAARKGLSVALVERGRRVGAKNVIGGILYTPVLERLFPDFVNVAPLERHIMARSFGFLTPDSHFAFEVRSDRYDTGPGFNHAHTVRRTALDPWLLEQARAAGVTLVPGTLVHGFLRDGDGPEAPVTGIQCGRTGGDIGAKMVILAEGANAVLAEAAGLRPKTRPEQVMLGVKELLALDRGVIEERFQLEATSGRAYEFFGDPAKGGFGSGFVYTNNETLSIGLTVSLAHLARKQLSPVELLDRFKSHPSVRPLLRGAEPLEYCAHLLPVGASDDLPRLTSPGLLLVGDAARLANMSHYKEFTNLVTASGEAAAEAAAEAIAGGDVSVRGLAGYEARLKAGFVLRDMRKYARLASLMERSPNLLEKYPRLLVESFVAHFGVSERPKDEVEKELLRKWNKEAKPSEIRRDLVDVLEAMGFSLVPLMRKMVMPAVAPGWGWLRCLWPFGKNRGGQQ